MDQIAFFWVGENIEIPSILVKSVRKVYPNNDIKITHLTNMKTPNIDELLTQFEVNYQKN